MAAIGIKLSSPGPVLHIAKRAGKSGRPFNLYKFRSMHLGADGESSITGINDSRIFSFGEFLRKTKIDEFPQFFNVILGQMSIVGPRPEAMDIVDKFYGELGMSTLTVRPGVVSPGSLFNYTHVEEYLGENSEDDYVSKFLSIKLSLEKVYLDKANFIYDLEIIGRTVMTIFQIALGKKKFPYPKEFNEAVKANLIETELQN